MKRWLVSIACAALVAPVLAQDTAKDAFRKVEKGTGQLLEGVGQEVKKATDAVSKAAKKDDKKAANSKDKGSSK